MATKTETNTADDWRKRMEEHGIDEHFMLQDTLAKYKNGDLSTEDLKRAQDQDTVRKKVKESILILKDKIVSQWQGAQPFDLRMWRLALYLTIKDDLPDSHDRDACIKSCLGESGIPVD